MRSNNNNNNNNRIIIIIEFCILRRNYDFPRRLCCDVICYFSGDLTHDAGCVSLALDKLCSSKAAEGLLPKGVVIWSVCKLNHESCNVVLKFIIISLNYSRCPKPIQVFMANLVSFGSSKRVRV